MSSFKLDLENKEFGVDSPCHVRSLQCIIHKVICFIFYECQ